MSTDNNIVSINAHQATELKALSPQHTKIIVSCRVILNKSLPKCFGFLDNLDDTLFKLADQAKNNQEQSEYFAVMRQFRMQQSNLKKKFTQLVLDDFDTFCSPPINAKSSAEQVSATPEVVLSILHNDDLEEDIAISQISIKSDKVFGKELGQLNNRLTHILALRNVTAPPLAVDKIATHLKDVISPITTNLSIKLLVYKQFEQHAIGELKILCQQLNDELIKHNVLPDLGKSIPVKKASSKGQLSPNNLLEEEQAKPSVLLDDGGSAEYDDNDQGVSVMFDELRQFLNKNGSAPVAHTTISRATNIANQQSILSALSGLQQLPIGQQSYSQTGAVQLPELHQSILSNLNSDGALTNRSVSSLDEDTIDVIDLLFEFILEDRAIPAPIRAMLARLQIPMLKVAISDKKFFSSKNHPARRLLNNLAKISTGWSQQQSDQQDLIQDKIDSVVTTILTQFDTDISLFEDLNAQLKSFIDQQDQSSTVAEQRIVKANEGQEKLISAQQEVDKVIYEQLSQYSHLPKVVISLINDGWQHVLKLRLLQKGLDSPEWRDSVKLLEELVWSVAPKPEPSDRKKLLTIIPNLLKELRAGLSGASFNQPKITALFKDLQACHIQCMNGNNVAHEDLQTVDELPSSPAAAEPAKLEPIPAEKKIISDEDALEKAVSLKIGTWLELSEEDVQRRIKFSWRSNLTGRCLFVTYQGLKAAEISLAELAALFQQGQALVIEQSEQLMDRALISMMTAVNSQENTENNEDESEK